MRISKETTSLSPHPFPTEGTNNLLVNELFTLLCLCVVCNGNSLDVLVLVVIPEPIPTQQGQYAQQAHEKSQAKLFLVVYEPVKKPYSKNISSQ